MLALGISVSGTTISNTGVTSVNGNTGAVTISGGISAVKGQIGSGCAANSTSMTLPSGGTWFVWNIFANGNGNVPYFATNTSVSNSGISVGGGTYAGGKTVYALHRSYEDVVASGKLAAIRIS